MIFLNFSQLPESVFHNQQSVFHIFLKIKSNFSLTEKCFPLTNFSNDKQTPESLESNFPKTTFRKSSLKSIFIFTFKKKPKILYFFKLIFVFLDILICLC
jgi:hypothetical protein